jgi:nucleotide-binding universal stress UspA family protein
VRILVAVDVHSGARAVVNEAVRWATLTDATLDVGFVDQFQHGAALVRDPQILEVVMRQWEAIRKKDEEALAALVASIPERHRGQTVYLSGRAADELVAAARGYDAIVVATHGRKGLEHVVLGSVAEKVVRRSPVPVIVLRLPEDADEARNP